MKKILIIEDHKQTAEALAIRLSANGYEVLTAPDGSHGLKLAMSNRPDLIIMDVWTPDGTGFRTAQQIKESDLRDIPLIFMTASRKQGLWKAAQELGAEAFFQKPFDSGKLLAAMQRALEGTTPETEKLLLQTTK